MDRLSDPGAVMDGYGWYPIQLLAWRDTDATRTADHNVDRVAGTVRESVEFGGGVIAEGGLWPGAQDGCPQGRLP